jgi:hypothetical protein
MSEWYLLFKNFDVNSITAPLLMNRIEYLRDFLYHTNRNIFTVSRLLN